jgi:Ca2+-binding RTX toxin-like protein
MRWPDDFSDRFEGRDLPDPEYPGFPWACRGYLFDFRHETADVRVAGLCGDDTILGGFGNDVLSGWGGDDHIEGGHGDDLIFGGTGSDQIFPGAGTNTAYGGEGDDVVSALFSSNTAYGGEGDDRLFVFGDAANLLVGDGGDDQFEIHSLVDGRLHGWHRNEAYGGAGADSFEIFGGSAEAYGGSGDDRFELRSGLSVFSWHLAQGGEGADSFLIGPASGTSAAHLVFLDGLDAADTVSLEDWFAAGTETLDSNADGVLDSADAHVVRTGDHTVIRGTTGDFAVIVFEEDEVGADQFMLV